MCVCFYKKFSLLYFACPYSSLNVAFVHYEYVCIRVFSCAYWSSSQRLVGGEGVGISATRGRRNVSWK